MLPKKTSTGLDENIANFVSYLLGWVSGLIMLLVEKNSANVRFHAAQSVVIFGSLTLISLLVPVIPGIGGLLQALVGVLIFGLWIVLMVTAVMDNAPRLPIAEDGARRVEEFVRKTLT